MCNPACIGFVERALTPADIAGKRVIEVGSRIVNGSGRASIEAYGPAEYVGVDMVPGPGVDIVMDAAKLLDRFDPESFDVVLSTEMVEHVRDWRSLFNDLKRLCAPNGIIVLTTRSRGFAYHGFPYDFWRYELSDMELVFSDFRIELLEQDPSDHQPGVFVKARRCESTQALDLSPIALYSVCTEDRRLDLSDLDLWRFRAQRRLMQGRRELTKATSTVKDRIPQRVKDPIKQRIGRGG